MAKTPAHPKTGMVDYETGLIRLPGKDPMPLVGPTTGQELQDLKVSDEKAKQLKFHIEHQLRNVWGCTQCKRLFSWFSSNPVRNILKRAPRVKWRKIDGVNAETLVCFDPRCDAPIVCVEDALSLVKGPGGRV